MLNKVLKWIRFSESVVAAIAYAVVASLLIIDVVGREVFSTAFLGMQQIAVYGAIVAGFLGLTLATSDNAHLRPEFLDFIGGRNSVAAFRLGDLISAVFFAAFAWVALDFVQISREVGDKAPVLYFLLWPIQLVIPYAFCSAALKHFIFALKPELRPAGSETAG